MGDWSNREWSADNLIELKHLTNMVRFSGGEGVLHSSSRHQRQHRQKPAKHASMEETFPCHATPLLLPSACSPRGHASPCSGVAVIIQLRKEKTPLPKHLCGWMRGNPCSFSGKRSDDDNTDSG